MKPITETEHPDEPRPPGETERDNDALRPTDPNRRKESGKGTPAANPPRKKLRTLPDQRLCSLAHTALNAFQRRLLPSNHRESIAYETSRTDQSHHPRNLAVRRQLQRHGCGYSAVRRCGSRSGHHQSGFGRCRQPQVVLEGPEGNQVHVQLTDKAKNLGNLKAGDQVNIKVIRSVAAYLDTDVDKGLPGTTERTGEVRAAPGSDNPGGEAYRQVQVQLKITKIDLKKNQVTFKTRRA